MTKKDERILFVYTKMWTFVKTDYEILSSSFDVHLYEFKLVKGFYKNFVQFVKQLLFLLFQILKYDIVYIWFADYHSFLPIFFSKMLKKKSYLVIGGYDIARDNKFAYGLFRSKSRSFFATYSMKNCTLNLTVSKYIDRKVRWIAPTAKTQVVYNCLNLNVFNKEAQNRTNTVLTVGLIDSERTFFIKGIDTFIGLAKKLPDYNFIIVGVFPEFKPYLLKDKPANLELVETVEHKELISYYLKSKIYCQFSRIESFGVAVIESISFGCTPIVTNVGGMPEIILQKELIVKRDLENITEVIQNQMKLASAAHSEFNLERFDMNKRKQSLLNIIKAN